MSFFSFRRKDQFDECFEALQARGVNHFINIIQLEPLCLQAVHCWWCICCFKESSFGSKYLFRLVIYWTWQRFFFIWRKICWTHTCSSWFLDVEKFVWNIWYVQFLCYLLIYNLFLVNGYVLIWLDYLNWSLSHLYLSCRDYGSHSDFWNRFSNDIWLLNWRCIFWNWSLYLNTRCHIWLDHCLIDDGQPIWCHVVLVNECRILLQMWLLSTRLDDRSWVDWSPQAIPEWSNCILSCYLNTLIHINTFGWLWITFKIGHSHILELVSLILLMIS